jgi:hypothetical protein
MDRWEAQYQFWNSFGVTAYEQNSVPDIKYLSYPYITYEAMAGGFDDTLSVTASIWDESTSWQRADELTDTIERAIALMLPVRYDGGMYRVWKGTPFAQNMGDPDNDKIRRKVLNVNFEFMDMIL